MKKSLLNFKIAIVTAGIFFAATANAAFTAVTSGNWSSAATWGGTAPTSTVSNQDITIPAGISVTLDADLTFSGLLNSVTVNGTLTNTSSNGITMTQGALAGNGTISINRLTFSTLASATFSGTANVKRMINSIAALGITAIVNVSDTLDLQSGSLLLNTNSNLTMMSNSTVKVNNGSIAIGGGVFNSGNAYNVMYVGSSKTTGIELNTVTLQHAYINLSSNTQSVTLNSNTTINGTLNIASGKLAVNGKQLTLKGDASFGSGASINSSSTSNIIILGSGTFTGMLMFDSGSSINDLTINRTTSGTVKLASGLNVVGHLNLMEGSLSVENSGTLTMNAGSTAHIEKGTLSLNTGTFVGTASYNAEYMGNTDVSAGTELTGSGLNNLTVNYGTDANKVTLNNNLIVSGQLNMTSGKLNLNGKNLTLNGTISQNYHGQFMGNSASQLALNLTSVTNDTLFFDNANNSLNKLTLNLGGTNPSIALGSALTIGNELAFVKGKVELVNGDMHVLSAAAITGFDDTKYVVTSANGHGSLIMNVNAGSAYVTFPVGTDNYSPAYVQQASTATSGDFSVTAMNTVLSGGTTGFVSSNTLKVVNRTWFVSSSVTNINSNLKFGWTSAAEVNSFDRTNAYVSHFHNNWDVVTTGSATAGANGTYELSRNGMTALSPFSVVQAGEPLKVKEITNSATFEVYPNPTKDFVSVKLNNGSDEFKYELTDITGRTITSTTNTNNVNKFDLSNLTTGCYFIKITNLSDNKTVTKRFIKD